MPTAVRGDAYALGILVTESDAGRIDDHANEPLSQSVLLSRP
jgi:hypothetical protein